MNDFHPDADWHTEAPPKASRTLILACLGSGFVAAVIVGLILKHGLF